MTYRSNSATRIFTNFGYVYEQLDNMHISVPEHSYQYDKYSHEFHCIMQMLIMYNYKICSIYKSSKGVNKN